MNSRNMPKIIVRLPPDVKKWLMEQTLENASSQTSEIVRALRERMDRRQAEVLNRGAGTSTPQAAECS